ncbi:LOW QUALITY PROTEIN: hypothetical protein KUF71_003637 [Frankliniella fusca]|uniref:Uncharacterized protein n=1 Tax=Frankliniella fusca TaxID=407009 RepID=A0AAE1LS17_9NEOP|nr:LOW QUALITY PROTEIN: hypothetical protein KUF71_003637 [Frankliniella fusca]
MVLIKLYFLTSLYQHHSSTVKTFASDFSSATTSTPATGLAPRQSQSIKSCPYLSNSQAKTFPTTSKMIKITGLLQPWVQLSLQHNSNNASTFASALNLTPTSAPTISTTSKKAEEMMEYCNTSCSRDFSTTPILLPPYLLLWLQQQLQHCLQVQPQGNISLSSLAQEPDSALIQISNSLKNHWSTATLATALTLAILQYSFNLRLSLRSNTPLRSTTSTTSKVLNKHWSTATLAAPLISAPLEYCFNLRLCFASNTSFSTSFTFSPKTNPVPATTSATDLDPNLDQIPDFKDCFNYSKNVQ